MYARDILLTLLLLYSFHRVTVNFKGIFIIIKREIKDDRNVQ